MATPEPGLSPEFALIARHFSRPTQHTLLGAGDDAAIVTPTPGMELVVTSDMLVAGTHFLPETDPWRLGWKTLAVNVSDLAAMGAQPRWATLALSLPSELAGNAPWLAAFASGFYACAAQHGVDLIGGDTTRGPLNLCVTLLGEAPAGRALRRAGARPDDDIWVSGKPGLAALGLAQLQGRVQLPAASQAACLSALEQPQPRLSLGLALAASALASAACDVSDCLLADLGHILERSHCAAHIELAWLPTAALECSDDHTLALECLLSGGDDFELIFTAAPPARPAIQLLSRTLGLALTRIGQILAGNAGELQLLDAHGQQLTPSRRGYDHFA